MTDPRLAVATSALLAVLPEAEALDLVRSMEIGIRRRHKQALNASARSALTEVEKASVCLQYSEAVRVGSRYGLVKRLARDFNVSRETIRKTVREGCANSEADGESTQPDITSAGYSDSHRANENDRP